MSPHLVDTTLFYSPVSGGVRRYLLEKHAWLPAHSRWQHTLLVPGACTQGHAGGIVEFASPEVHAGYRWPVRGAAFRSTLAALQPDVIEAADPYRVGWQAARVAEALQIPSIAFCHSDLIGLVRGRLGPVGSALASRYLRTLYARFTRVLAPSRVVAERLQDAGITAVDVQPLGVDAAIFSPARRNPRLRQCLGLPANTRLLVFAGRVAPEKNLSHLHEMVRRLGAPYHLLVVGGEGASRPTAGVTYLPYEAEPVRLAMYLASADALVHAGRQETFGLIALEALACGTPVVAYAAGALAELVDDGVGALATPTGPAALADAVAALFERDAATLRRAARERVLTRHTWAAAFARQVRLYDGLLASHGSAAPDVLHFA